MNNDHPVLVSKVYIVLLNYRGWRDTIECLESVLKMDYANFQIVIVDNNSGDGSLEQIRAWALGVVESRAQNPVLAQFSTPPSPKPIRTCLITEGAAVPPLEPGTILMLQSNQNGGYAAGNNLGISLAMGDPECAYIWLLNNDTVVASDALSQLTACMQRNSGAGICGSTLVHYHNPATVQAFGGARFNRWLATSHHLGEGEAFEPLKLNDTGMSLDYVIGASMFVSRAFVTHAGLMYEGYFLYFEEIDWAWQRGRFQIAYAPKSVVYHKEGGTTGMDKRRVQYGIGGDYYLHRNRLLFARRNFPLALPIVAARLLGVLAKSILAGRYGRVRMLLKPAFWFGSGKL